jgi:hypothetical protein
MRKNTNSSTATLQDNIVDSFLFLSLLKEASQLQSMLTYFHRGKKIK